MRCSSHVSGARLAKYKWLTGNWGNLELRSLSLAQHQSIESLLSTRYVSLSM